MLLNGAFLLSLLNAFLISENTTPFFHFFRTKTRGHLYVSYICLMSAQIKLTKSSKYSQNLTTISTSITPAPNSHPLMIALIIRALASYLLAVFVLYWFGFWLNFVFAFLSPYSVSTQQQKWSFENQMMFTPMFRISHCFSSFPQSKRWHPVVLHMALPSLLFPALRGPSHS